RSCLVSIAYFGADGSDAISSGGASFTIAQQTGSALGSSSPVSHPQVYIGSAFNVASEDSGLPNRVDSISTIDASMSYSSAGVSEGLYNALFELRFSTSAAGDSGAASAGYLQVWLHDPASVQPYGAMQGSVTLNGVTYAVWVGTHETSRPIITYVRSTNATSATLELSDFVYDARQRGAINSTWYLTSVSGGFEIWNGGEGLSLTSFSAQVQ